MIEKRVLFTNLSYVSIGDVRTSCHALLLEHDDDPLGRGTPRCQLRGFGTEAAWPVFDVRIPTIAHEIRTDRGDHLVIPGGPEILLWRDTQEQPICVQTFEWDSADNERGHRFGEIWTALESSVARHWHAPYMPRLVHMEPARALKLPSRAASWGSP
jgi:hypothetical protein